MRSYKITKYPDGTSYVTIPESWEDSRQNITFRINSYEQVIHLAQLCDVLIHNRVQAHIVIPCLLDAQADRRFDEFQSSGLTVLARIIDTYTNNNGLSFGIFHPHNPEVVEALFTSTVIIDNKDFISKVLYNLGFDQRELFSRNESDLILMSSDAGGFKPLMKLCDQLQWTGEVFSAAKARSWSVEDGTKFTQQINRDDFDGKDILIIDDLSIGGGTFKGLSKLLKARNCGKLYLAVSHMTVENLGTDPVTDYFDKVFTTNSKYDYYGVPGKDFQPNQPKNLEILKMF